MITPLLADATANWLMGTTIVSCLACVGAVIIALVALNTKTATVVSPQPLIVALEKEFVSRKDFKEHVGAFTAHATKCDDAHVSIGKRITEVEKYSSSEIERHIEIVREQIYEVGRYVSGLQTATKLQDQQLNRMERNVSELPSKIVADLRNAKGLLD
jgi:hypothetical protein